MKLDHIEKQQQGMALLRQYARNEERLKNPLGLNRLLISKRIINRLRHPEESNPYRALLREKE